MNYGLRFERKPVAVELFMQNGYAESPFRQVEYEFLLIEQGHGTYFFGNNAESVHEGDFLFIDSFEEHYFKPDSDSPLFRCCRLLFEVAAIGNEGDSCRAFFLSAKFCRFLNMPEQLISHIFEVAKQEENIPARELILRSILFDILACAIHTQQYESISDISISRKRSLSAIENALVFIRENYAENLSLQMILQLTNYSKSQFIRLFKESTGMNVSEYINKYRIEKACLDLIYTKKNITEIATANGFNNIQYFSRKFREYMKCTPKQYQKKSMKLTERQ